METGRRTGSRSGRRALKPSLVEWKHIIKCSFHCLFPPLETFLGGMETLVFFFILFLFITLLETFLGGMETVAFMDSGDRTDEVLETFLGGMETQRWKTDHAHRGDLETFLGGMETKGRK